MVKWGPINPWLCLARAAQNPMPLNHHFLNRNCHILDRSIPDYPRFLGANPTTYHLLVGLFQYLPIKWSVFTAVFTAASARELKGSQHGRVGGLRRCLRSSQRDFRAFVQRKQAINQCIRYISYINLYQTN